MLLRHTRYVLYHCGDKSRGHIRVPSNLTQAVALQYVGHQVRRLATFFHRLMFLKKQLLASKMLGNVDGLEKVVVMKTKSEKICTYIYWNIETKF